MNQDIQNTKIALLGGGQLGKMLLQEAYNLDLNIKVMDPVSDCSCSRLAQEFVVGDFKKFEDVVSFGADADIVTIEFEDVNVEALYELERQGKKVFPQPRVLEIIKDKGLQKQFYQENNIPTGKFHLVDNKSNLLNLDLNFPVFQKVRKGGYDGYGVVKLDSVEDIKNKAFDSASVIEEAVKIKKELSVIVSRNENGETSIFPAVEMVFNEVNMVDFLASPARISKDIEKKAAEIALEVITKLNMIGILAVEMFLTDDDEVWVNEIAPRPHNSGHHTIEANYTSQYGQHLRSILNLSPGNTVARSTAIMMNILGEKGFSGKTKYTGLDLALKHTGVYIHLYGKMTTKPFRKMGHATILCEDIEKGMAVAHELRKHLKVVAQ